MQNLLGRAAARKGPRRSPGQPGVSRATRVLVADPHEDTLASTTLLLRLWGHEVRCARNGHEALATALDYRPDVVLMEMGLPGMDGCEVARRLRGHQGIPRQLLVAVTGYGGEEHQQRTREAGFDLHLVKPACPRALQELLASCRQTTGGM